MLIYTKKGIYHQDHGEVCGDILLTHQDDTRTVIVVADGVSTCEFGAEGADIAAHAAMDYITDRFDSSLLIPSVWGRLMLQAVEQALRSQAKALNHPWKEYACTLLTVVIDYEKGTLEYCNLGDGLLLAIRENGCSIVGMPQLCAAGCPVITTMGASRLARFGSAPLDSIESILACTDGAWKLMYRRDRLLPEVRQQLMAGQYEAVLNYIDKQQNFDDCGIAIARVGKAG